MLFNLLTCADSYTSVPTWEPIIIRYLPAFLDILTESIPSEYTSKIIAASRYS